jgi:hypothetical protein
MSARKQGGHLVVVPQVPAKPARRSLADFDKWLALGRELDDWCEKYWDLLPRLQKDELYWEEYPADEDGDSIKMQWRPSQLAGYWLHKGRREELIAQVAKFDAGWALYNGDELYEADGHIRHQVICEKVAALLGAYPNAVPHSPEVFVPRLIEEIAAADPSAVQLEAACRRLVRTCTFLPTVAEVLKALAETAVTFDATARDDGGEAPIINAHKLLEKALAKLPAPAAPSGSPIRTKAPDPANDMWDPAL